jgi:transcriptional regulator with XRE-family HTH domain
MTPMRKHDVPRYKSFRETLISARARTGLTQRDIATHVARPQSFVSKYELGERRLDVVEFIHVARALEMDPLKLFAAVVADQPALAQRAARRAAGGRGRKRARPRD